MFGTKVLSRIHTCQGYKAGTVSEPLKLLAGSSYCQAGLAHSARTNQGEQPAVWVIEQGIHLPQLAFMPNKAGQVCKG